MFVPELLFTDYVAGAQDHQTGQSSKNGHCYADEVAIYMDIFFCHFWSPLRSLIKSSVRNWRDI